MLFVKILIGLIGCCLALSGAPQHKAQAFWLTDGTLFADRVAPAIKPQFESVQQQQQQSASNRVTQFEAPTSQRLNASEPSGSGKSQAETWTRLVGEQNVSSSRSVAQSQPSQLGQDSKRTPNELACQCNADWLQSQTNLWLNKWTSSASFAQHLQHSISRLANSSALAGRSVAWSRPSKRHSNAAGFSATKQEPARHAAGHQAKSASNSQQPAHSLQVARGEQGLKGEPGERGPAGERGPSALISVKDREALFDLAASAASSAPLASPSEKQNGEKQAGGGAGAGASQPASERRLVFVESEQLLVVDTPTGWRPVQMLAPLRDLRKTIAKFTLTAADAKRLRLASELEANKEASMAAAAAATVARAPSVRDKRLREMKTILRAGALDALVDEEAEEEDEEEEDDDDDADENNGQEDKFEDGAEERMGNKLEDDEDQDDEDDETEAEEAQEEGEVEDERENAINSDERPTSGRVGGAKLATGNWPQKQLAGDLAGKAWKRRRVQVSGRSAVAPAPASAIETNMIAAGADSSDEQEPPTGRARDTQQAHVMKLRLVALNEPFAGNQHGLRGANFECKRHAARANVKGAFRALLATNYQNLNEIVRYSAAPAHVQKYPIVNLRGETLASSWHDLFKSPARMTNPLSRIYSFDGRHVSSDPNWPNKLVWHGAASKFGNRDSPHNCDGWHSDSLNKFGFATPIHSPKGFAHRQQHAMKESRHQQRRGLEAANQPARAAGAAGSNSSAPGALVFDLIEKFPCRMPLIVLCIETVAQNGE